MTHSSTIDPRDCLHPQEHVLPRNGQFLAPTDVEPGYVCRLCGATHHSPDDFKIFRQSDWLRLFLERCEARGLRVIGVEADEPEYMGTSSIAEAMSEIEGLEEGRVWLQAQDGVRCWAMFAFQGPDESYQQASEIVTDFSRANILDPIWMETQALAKPMLKARNAGWME